MVSVVPSMSLGVVVPALAVATSASSALAIATRSSWSAPLMLGTMRPRSVAAAMPSAMRRRTTTSPAASSNDELIPGFARAAWQTPSATIVRGESLSPARAGRSRSEATRSIVRVMSTLSHADGLRLR